MPNTHKDDEIRQAVLQAARRVFQRWGSRKTTMEDIAREAGKGKSTLYYYFESKEQIFDTVLMEELSALLSRAKAAVRHVPSPKERLKGYVTTCLTEIKNAATLYDIVRGELSGDPMFIEKLRKQFEPAELRYLSRILAEGVQKKEFAFSSRKEMRMAAEVVLKMIRALELHFFLEDFDAEHVDLAARFIANGI